MTFGELLLSHRRAAGLTQAALSKDSGVSVRALRDLESGRALAAQQRSAEVLADGLRLAGDDRRTFLEVAREARRRGPKPDAAISLSGLPDPVPDLFGRDAELERMATLANDGGTIVIVGPPGVGKTALAVFAAGMLRSQYPDGLIAVNLRGMDDRPVTSRTALNRLLRASGVPRAEIPISVSDQASLYQSRITDRRVLVVLDNAADEAQLRPLLAVTPGCLTLVTSRRTLAGLESVRWLWLEPVADESATRLLASIAGPDRVEAERAAAAELTSLCGNLPLAVRIAADQLVSQPDCSLIGLVGQLRDERTRLGLLSMGDLQVRTAFETSYRRLPHRTRLFLRRLAALADGDFGVELAQVATGSPGPATLQQLDELADASLLQVTTADGRFQFHDLVRLFVNERWEAEEEQDRRDQAVRAVLEHLIGTATAASLMFFPEQSDGTVFKAPAEAADWLAREEVNWLAALREASRRGWNQKVIKLTESLHWYSDVNWTAAPWEEVFQLGVDAARQEGERRSEAKLLNFLGWARQACRDDAAGAAIFHREALAVAVDVEDRNEQAWSRVYLGGVLMLLGRLEEALDQVQQAQVLAADLGFWPVQVPIRYRLSRVLAAMDRQDQALTVLHYLLEEAGQVQEELLEPTQRHMIALIKEAVGSCLFANGEWPAAAEAFGESRRLFSELGSSAKESDTALGEGKARLRAHEYAGARSCLESALAGYDGVLVRDRRDEVRAELAEIPTEYFGA